jgi:hypothetical protein
MICYSHLKNRREILIHITAITIMTITGRITLSIGKPSEAVLRSLIPLCASDLPKAH